MKQSPEDFFREQERIGELVSKFECNVFDDGTTAVWFDSEDIEDICNFYLELGKPEKAEKAVSLGERLHPTDELMPMLRAHVLIEEDRAEDALELLDTVSYKSDYYWHYLRMGALADMERWGDACKEAEAVRRFDQNDVKIVLDISRVFSDRGRLDLAIRYLLKADNNSADPDLLNAIAHCYEEMRRYGDAMPYAERLIDIDPYQASAWQLKASLHLDMFEYEKAEDAYEYALAINPDNENIVFSYSKLLMFEGKEKRAFQMLDDFALRVPQWKGICIMLRADSYFYKGDYRKAHALYYKGFDKRLFLADSVVRYIECKSILQKWKGVVSVGSFLLKFTPDDVKLTEMVADAYACQKQYAMSAKLYRHCLRLEPESVYLLLRYGSLMLDMQDIKRAYYAINKAYKLMPAAAQTNLMMAVVCYLRKEYRRMYHHYRSACQLDKSMKKLFVQLCPEVKKYVYQLDSLARKCQKAGIENVEEFMFRKK